MPSAIDATKPVAGSPTTESVRQNFAAAKSEIELLQQTAGVGPQGPKGDTGPAGAIDIGTVTTGIAGSNASITAGGTPQARILNFTIPRGDTGAGGGGITETEAVDAVRQGQVRFEEATVVNAPTFPTTPNVITTAPVGGVGWALTGADPILGPWTHTTGTSPLAFPMAIVAGEVYQIVFTMATTDDGASPTQLSLFFANGTSVPPGDSQSLVASVTAGSVTFIARAERNFNHFWFYAASSTWQGSITVTRIVRAVTLNSQTLQIKDQLLTARATIGSLFLGGGGRAFMGTGNNAQSIGLGINSLAGITTGSNNCGLGKDSLASVSSGGNNCAIGVRSLASNTTGGSNTAVGNYALTGGVVNSNSTALGYYALGAYPSGARHTAVGAYAMQYGLVGINNDSTAVGAYALMGSTTAGKQHGGQNTAVGANAGRYLTGTTVAGGATASVFIGYNTRPLADGQQNQIVIGTEATGHGSNTITLGNDAITALHCNVQTILALSDSRVKEDVQPANLDLCLNAVRNLPVSRWGWQPIAGAHPDKHVTGFMADDVAKVFPKAITKEDRHLTVRGADGKPEMTMATETVEDPSQGDMAPGTAAVKTETRLIEKTVEIKDLQYVSLTEALPTLWGAVQRIIQAIDDIERRMMITPG